MSEVAELIERLRSYAYDDHNRLCKGREYSCTCGYDEKRNPLLADAADTLATLTARVAELERERDAYLQGVRDADAIVAGHAARADAAEARLAKAVEALRPFAEYLAGGTDSNHLGEPLPDTDGVGWVYLTMGDFRRARAALSELEGNP